MSTAAQAASVVWSATINGLDLASGADAPVGSLVRLGTFSITDAEIIANAGNLGYLNDRFTEFGSALVGDGGRGPGHFSTISNNNTATASALAGSQIYVWAFSSGTLATASEHGIFYMPKSADMDWQFPAQVPIPGATQIGLDDLTDAATSTALRPEAKVLVGAFGPGTSDTTTKPNFMLAVPEPTSATLLMAAVGVVGLVRRRR